MFEQNGWIGKHSLSHHRIWCYPRMAGLNFPIAISLQQRTPASGPPQKTLRNIREIPSPASDPKRITRFKSRPIFGIGARRAESQSFHSSFLSRINIDSTLYCKCINFYTFMEIIYSQDARIQLESAKCLMKLYSVSVSNEIALVSELFPSHPTTTWL